MAKSQTLARRVQGLVLAAVFPATLVGLVINNGGEKPVYDRLQEDDYLTYVAEWSEDADARQELRQIATQIQLSPGRGSDQSDFVPAAALIALLQSGDEDDYRFLAGGLVNGTTYGRVPLLISPAVLEQTQPDKIVLAGLALWDGLSEHERYGFSRWIESFEGRSVSPMRFAQWASVARSQFEAGEGGQAFFRPEVIARFSLGHDVSKFSKMMESGDATEREFGARFISAVPAAQHHFGLKESAVKGLESSDPVVRAASEEVLDRIEGRDPRFVASN